jgi:hypothetical protein
LNRQAGLVRCTYKFARMNLDLKNYARLVALQQRSAAARGDTAAVHGSQAGDGAAAAADGGAERRALLPTVEEAYGQRLDPAAWQRGAALSPAGLQEQSLRDFGARFFVGRDGKIVAHQDGERIMIFYPALSSHREGNPRFHEYCMYYLVAHKPWVGTRHNAWGGAPGQELCADTIVAAYDAFVEELRAAGRPVPGTIHQHLQAARHVVRQQGGQEEEEGEFWELEQPADDGANSAGAHDAWMDMCRQVLLQQPGGGDIDELQCEWDQQADWVGGTEVLANLTDEQKTALGTALSDAKRNGEHQLRQRERRVVLPDTLNAEQRLAHDLVLVACTGGLDGGPLEQRLLMLTGLAGTGKSWTIDAIVSSLNHPGGQPGDLEVPEDSEERVMVTATTGMSRRGHF